MRSTAFLIALAALAGCANTTNPALGPDGGLRVVGPGDVVGCTPLKSYRTEPGLYGPVIGQQALEAARNVTLDNAREDGADTVVFLEGGPGEQAFVVRAEGYVCGG